MRFVIALAIAGISACPLTSTAADPVAVMLSFKSSARANSAVVRVSDVVLVRSSDASAATTAGLGEITLQPGPGSSAVLDRRDVVAAIGKIDGTLLTRLTWSGADRVNVAKAGRWLGAEESTSGAEQALRHWLSSRVTRYELQAYANANKQWIETEAKVQYVIPSTAKIRQQMPVHVEITDANGKIRSFPRWFTVSASRDVWMLTRDMSAGELILPADLAVQTTDIAALNGESFSSDLSIHEQMMVVPAKAGTVLLQSQVKPRPDVLVGETVAIKLNVPKIQLETTGLALHSAERGSRVVVRNMRSGETLTARVAGRDVVEVGP